MNPKNHWTASEEAKLQTIINQHPENLSLCFEMFAKDSKHTKGSTAYHYYAKMKNREETKKVSSYRPWTKSEEDRLLRQITAFPGNISWCCMIVAPEIGRSQKACAHHWYRVLSKRPGVIVNLNVSEKQVLKNRKNGKGMPSNSRIWKRVLLILRKFI